jgi:hypothetical protein
MTSVSPDYILELEDISGIGSLEPLFADSDQEALELVRLRLLLGPDYLVVRLTSAARPIATFRRDNLRQDYRLVH